MDMGALKIILLSPLGQAFGSLARTLITAIILCGGVQLFDFKNLWPFFKWKRVFGLFLLIFGSESLIRILFFRLDKYI